MSDILKLDLDTIVPAKGEVTIGGKAYDIEAPDLGATVALYKVAYKFDALQKGEAEAEAIMAAVEEMVAVIEPLIPGLKADGVKLNFMQASQLLVLLIKMTVPPETTAMAEAGIKVDEMAEKKTE